MEEKKITYYLIKGRMLGKREDDKDYLYGEEGWIPDVSMEIMKRLYGFDPSEPEDSPYAVGNTDIMEELEEIGCEKAEKWMAGKLLQGLVRKWKIKFADRKAEWDKNPKWPSKLVETRFYLGGQTWSIGPTDIGLTRDGWDQGFMETIRDEMEADLKKIGATEIVSFGFLD